ESRGHEPARGGRFDLGRRFAFVGRSGHRVLPVLLPPDAPSLRDAGMTTEQRSTRSTGARWLVAVESVTHPRSGGVTMHARADCLAWVTGLLLLWWPQVHAQSSVDASIDKIEPSVIAWRRHIHQNPELSFQEVKTAAYVAERLRAIGALEVQTGI